MKKIEIENITIPILVKYCNGVTICSGKGASSYVNLSNIPIFGAKLTLFLALCLSFDTNKLLWHTQKTINDQRDKTSQEYKLRKYMEDKTNLK